MIFETERFGLRAFWRGDWELRVGRSVLTILYNGRGDGGVFLRAGHRQWHRPWPGGGERPISGIGGAAVI